MKMEELDNVNRQIVERSDELVQIQSGNASLSEKIEKLEKELSDRQVHLDCLTKRLEETFQMKIKESRDEIENAHIIFMESLKQGMNLTMMPLVCSQLIVPLARRFLDWNISFCTRNGVGGAYIDVTGMEDDCDTGFIIWRDILVSEDVYFIRCEVGKSFIYPGWNSDTCSVKSAQFFETIESVYSNLRELALEYYASQPPESDSAEPPIELLDSKETPEEIFEIPVELIIAHNGC
jgi:hypothetical protein